MYKQFDDISRILASQMPRRQALKDIGSVLSGTFLASLGLREAWAVQCLPGLQRTNCPDRTPTCCKIGTGGDRNVGIPRPGDPRNGRPFGCCPPNTNCCKNIESDDDTFLRTTGQKGCCPPNHTCCDTQPVRAGDVTACCPKIDGKDATCCARAQDGNGFSPTGPPAGVQPPQVEGCCPPDSRCCFPNTGPPKGSGKQGCCPKNNRCCEPTDIADCCPDHGTCCEKGKTACCPGVCCHDQDDGPASPQADCCPQPNAPGRICCQTDAKLACCPVVKPRCCTQEETGPNGPACCGADQKCCKDKCCYEGTPLQESQGLTLNGVMLFEGRECCRSGTCGNCRVCGLNVHSKLLVDSGAAAILRLSLNGTADTDEGDAFTADRDLSGTLSAFDFTTRTLIESQSFSLLTVSLNGDDFVALGLALASVDGVITRIEFEAVKTGNDGTFDIFDVDTGDLILGGIGEPDRGSFELSLTEI